MKKIKYRYNIIDMGAKDNKRGTTKKSKKGKLATTYREYSEKKARKVKRPSPLRKEIIPDSEIPFLERVQQWIASIPAFLGINFWENEHGDADY